MNEKYIEKIKALIFDDFFQIKIVESLIDKKKTINDLFQIERSLMINNAMNVLVCRLENIKFLVFQHVSFADFIYFYDAGFKFRCHVNQNIADNALKQFENLDEGNVDGLEFEFGGIIASHGRPAHFFYDTVLGIKLLEDSDLLCRISKVFQIEGCDFLNFEKIYPFGFGSEIINANKLNKLAKEQRQIFFKVGGFYGYGDQKKKTALARFDAHLIKTAECNHNDVLERLVALKLKGYLLIWHGITTDKRRWLEQEDAIVDFVKKLELESKKVVLVVDGWTSPGSPTNFDRQQIVNDLEIFKNISSKLPISISSETTIGLTAEEKISIAKMIDFHISNAGTGSLYTARVARKYGVLHIANRSLKMTEQSIHYNSRYVPSDFVSDFPNPEFDRDDFVSYSIDIESFSKFTLDEFRKIQNSVVQISQVINCGTGDTYQYRAINDDPIVLLDIVVGEKYLHHKIAFNFEMSTDLNPDSVKPKFYLDFGSGFNEENVICGKYSDGVVSTEFFNKENLTALRFDPFESKGNFTLGKMEIIFDEN